jgi:hypothetical protein
MGAWEDPPMRWIVTIETRNRRDMERLLAQPSHLAAGESPREAIVEFCDELDEATDESRQAVRTQVEKVVRHLNGVGKLKWGRTFEGVTVGSVRHINSAGKSGQVVFLGAAHGHLTPHEFGDFVERIGQPRPKPPFRLDDVEALELADVADLADRAPIAARVLGLIELMLAGDQGIDWSAAYSALEVIENDAGDAANQWRPTKQRRRFTGTANSYEAVGDRSRHGKQYSAPKDPMSSSEGNWFLRGIAARCSHGGSNGLIPVSERRGAAWCATAAFARQRHRQRRGHGSVLIRLPGS